MFQTNLPSGRRRLFLVLIILFAITVFGMRYLLISLGWIGEQTEISSPTKPPPSEQTQLPSEPPLSTISTAEIKQAKSKAESFIKRYTQHDLAKSQVWFASLQADLHPTFAKVLKLEAERSRPTTMVQRINFKTLRRTTCDPVAEKVYCHLQVMIETIDGHGQATLTDKGYEVILVMQNGNWKIEGLNIYGSLD